MRCPSSTSQVEATTPSILLKKSAIYKSNSTKGMPIMCRFFVFLAISQVGRCLAYNFFQSSAGRSPFGPKNPLLQHKRQPSLPHPPALHPSSSLFASSLRDWSEVVDGGYLITCPNGDPGSFRLNRSKEIISEVGLTNLVEGE